MKLLSPTTDLQEKQPSLSPDSGELQIGDINNSKTILATDENGDSMKSSFDTSFSEKHQSSQDDLDNNNNNNSSLPPQEIEGGGDLQSCPLCNRKFLSDRLEKHMIICQKLKEKKRNLFDSVKKRAENLDKINNYPTELHITETSSGKPTGTKQLKNNAAKSTTTTNKKQSTKNNKDSNNNLKNSDWRQQHQEFTKTIRQARDSQADNNNDDDGGGQSTQTDSNNTSKPIPKGFVECPTCSRRFSNKAADRHIEWCSEKHKNKQQASFNVSSLSSANSDSSKNQEALERMKARTKYKPPLPTTNQQKKLVRSRSYSTSSRPVSSKSSDAISETNTSAGKSSNNSKPIRKYTKVISKSSDSLNVGSSKNMASNNLMKRSTPQNNKTMSKRTTLNQETTTNNHLNHESHLKRNSNTNRTTTIRKAESNSNLSTGTMRHVTSKIDTGRNSTASNYSTATDNGKKSAPVMKFKEKFPNHQQQRLNGTQSIIDQFQDIEQILRRNSTPMFDDSPKTVPGVRTGGISPTKHQSNTKINTNDNDDYEKDLTVEKNSNNMSKSEINIHSIGRDIKERIDQYINRVYENDIWKNYGTGRNNRTDGDVVPTTQNLNLQEQNSIETLDADQQATHQLGLLNRQNSAQSDEAGRGSTSDSSDSGVGAVYGTQVNGKILETVTEDRKMNSGSSSRTYNRADMSPPIYDDVELNKRLLQRNAEIERMMSNDLKSFKINGVGSDFTGSLSDIPKFCHHCGTKYPNMTAKFCYECGYRRFAEAV